MYGPSLGIVERPFIIQSISQYIEESSQSHLSYGHFDGLSRLNNFHMLGKTFRR